MNYRIIPSLLLILLAACNAKPSEKSAVTKTDTVFVEKTVFVQTDLYPSPFNCADSISQADMNMCADKEYRYYDSIMQFKYDSLLKSFEPKESDESDIKKYLGDQKKLLIASQDLWKKYMDKNAELVARQWQGGTIMPFMVAEQKSADTWARIIALDNLRSVY